MNKALVIGGMLAAVAGALLFSGSATPIFYGASEATTQTVSSSVVGMLLTVGGLFTSAFQVLKSGAVADFAKGALANIQQGDTHGTGVDAAFVAIVTAVLLKKKTIDPTLLAEIGAVRNKVQTELDAK